MIAVLSQVSNCMLMEVGHKSDWVTLCYNNFYIGQGFKFGLHSNLNLIPPNPDLCSTLLLIILLTHEIVGPKFMLKMINLRDFTLKNTVLDIGLC